MEPDTLARRIGELLTRGDLSSPPFPAYFARAAASAQAASAEEAEGDRSVTPFAIESLHRVEERRCGEIELFVYRLEPGASALLIGLRGDAVEYVSLLGGLFSQAALEAHGGVVCPLSSLVAFALAARARGETDARYAGIHRASGGPTYVNFEMERARYETLSPEERAELHRSCARIARDASLLHQIEERDEGDVVMSFYEPQTGSEYHLGPGRPGMIEQVQL